MNSSQKDLYSSRQPGDPTRADQRPPPSRPPQLEHDQEEDDVPDDVSMIQPIPPLPALPEIPAAELDFSFSLDAIIGSSSAASSDKVQKRASNVLKLSEENEKLKQELRAMSDRLEAAERRRKELESRRAHDGTANPPSTGTPF